MPISPPSTWRRILLIRHGATALNSDDHTVDRIRGWQDWPLSKQGVEEARLLAMQINKPLAALLCSNLTRAEQTASIIADELNIPYQTSAYFLPWDVGEFVGKAASEVVPILARYATETPNKVVPGGESFNSFSYRFFDGLLSALLRHDGLLGIVTHYRNERLLKAWAKAGYRSSIDPDEFTMKGKTTGHCEIIEVPVDSLTKTVREGLVKLHLARRHVDENAGTR